MVDQYQSVSCRCISCGFMKLNQKATEPHSHLKTPSNAKYIQILIAKPGLPCGLSFFDGLIS
jgi:hypothetical protein